MISPRGDIVKSQAPLMFMWSPLPDAKQYVIMVSDDPSAGRSIYRGTTPSSSIVYPSDAPPLKEGVTYFWKVLPADANGNPVGGAQGVGEVASFRLKSEGDASTQPQYRLGLMAPKGEVDRARLMFMWTTVPNAFQYRVMLSEDPNMGRPLWSETTPANNLMYPPDGPMLTEGKQYFWGVVALDQGQNPIGAPAGTRGWPDVGLKSEIGQFSLRSLVAGGPAAAGTGTPGGMPGGQPGGLPMGGGPVAGGGAPISPFDANMDGVVDAKDMDMMRAMHGPRLADLMKDQRVDRRDLEWLKRFHDQKINDVNSDGKVDEKDAMAMKEIFDRVFALSGGGGSLPPVQQGGFQPGGITLLPAGGPMGQGGTFQPGGVTLPVVGGPSSQPGGFQPGGVTLPSLGGNPVGQPETFQPVGGIRDLVPLLNQAKDRAIVAQVKDYELMNIRLEPMPTPEELAKLLEQLKKGEAQVIVEKVE